MISEDGIASVNGRGAVFAEGSGGTDASEAVELAG